MDYTKNSNIGTSTRFWSIITAVVFAIDIIVLLLLCSGYSVIWLSQTYYLFLIGLNIVLLFILFHKCLTKRRLILALLSLSFAIFISCAAVWLFHPYQYFSYSSPKGTNHILIQYRKDLLEARISNYTIYQQKYGILMKKLPPKKITITVPEDVELTQKEVFDYMNPQWMGEDTVKIYSRQRPYVFRLK